MDQGGLSTTPGAAAASIQALEAELEEARAVADAAIATGNDTVHLTRFLRAIPFAEQHEDVCHLVESTCKSIGAQAQTILLDGNRWKRHSDPHMDTSLFESIHRKPRMFNLGKRTVVNHERVMIILDPTGDPSFDGRMRDTASILAECIDSHCDKIEAKRAAEQAAGAAGRAARELTSVMDDLAFEIENSRILASERLNEMADELSSIVGALALPALQRQTIRDCAIDGIGRVLAGFDRDDRHVLSIRKVVDDLTLLIERKDETASVPAPRRETVSSVELF